MISRVEAWEDHLLRLFTNSAFQALVSLDAATWSDIHFHVSFKASLAIACSSSRHSYVMVSRIIVAFVVGSSCHGLDAAARWGL